MNFDHSIDLMREAIITSTQKLIQIPSVEGEASEAHPYGAEVHNTLIHTLALADSMGFEVRNVDNQVGYAEIGSGEEMIGVLVHLDVVPAGEGWSVDPFGGDLIDGKLYGRGAGDDKGPAIAALYAVKAIADSGLALSKRIRVIFGLNEETDWKSIRYYTAHEELPTAALVPDASFPVIYGEKGVLDFDLTHPVTDALQDGGIEILRLSGGERSNMVPDHAEALIKATIPFEHIAQAYAEQYNLPIDVKRLEGNEFLISVTGISAHAARPKVGVNAISHLINLLDKIDLQIGDRANFVRTIARHIGLDYNGQNIGCGFEDEDSGKLTFNAGTVRLDDTEAVLTCNIRYPLASSREAVIEGIKESLSYTRFEYRENAHLPSLHVDKDSELVQILMRVYQECTGRDDPAKTMGGATYARSMPQAVSFGAKMPTRESLAHQKDEYIPVEELILTAKIYARALYELAK